MSFSFQVLNSDERIERRIPELDQNWYLGVWSNDQQPSTGYTDYSDCLIVDPGHRGAFDQPLRFQPTLEMFRDEVYHASYGSGLPPGATPVHRVTDEYPGHGPWTSGTPLPPFLRLPPDKKLFVSCASFIGDSAPENFAGLHCLVLNGWVKDTKPSWAMSVFPGIWQVGYILREVEKSRTAVERLLTAANKAGLTNATARDLDLLACAPTNLIGQTKFDPVYGPYQSHFTDWNPKARYSMAELKAAIDRTKRARY